jgi:hypothetical protein
MNIMNGMTEIVGLVSLGREADARDLRRGDAMRFEKGFYDGMRAAQRRAAKNPPSFGGQR